MKTERIEDALRLLITAFGSQAGAARVLGVHRSHVTRLLQGKVEFGPKLADKLGFRRVVTYERKKVNT